MILVSGKLVKKELLLDVYGDLRGIRLEVSVPKGNLAFYKERGIQNLPKLGTMMYLQRTIRDTYKDKLYGEYVFLPQDL